MKRNYCLAVFALLTGCTSISDVSRDERFSRFTNSTIVLSEQVLVCQDRPLATKSGARIQNGLIYNINEITSCPFGRTVGILLPGAKIQIDRIERHHVIDVFSYVHIYFIGRAMLGDGESFDFFYLYGFEGHYDLQPW